MIKADFCLFPWEINCRELLGNDRECVGLDVFPGQWLLSVSNPGPCAQGIQNLGPGKTLSWAASSAGGQVRLCRSHCTSLILPLTPRARVLGSILQAPNIRSSANRAGCSLLLMKSRHLIMQDAQPYPPRVISVYFEPLHGSFGGQRGFAIKDRCQKSQCWLLQLES